MKPKLATLEKTNYDNHSINDEEASFTFYGDAIKGIGRPNSPSHGESTLNLDDQDLEKLNGE